MPTKPEVIEQHRLQQEAYLGRLFAQLAAGVEFVILFFDGEDFSLDAVMRDGERRVVRHERPMDLLAGLLKTATLKRCLGPCGRELPHKDFGSDKNNPDGLLRRCRTCERIRVQAYTRRRSRQRRPTETSDAASVAC